MYALSQTNLVKLIQISDSLCFEYALSVLDEDKFYKRTYTKSISNDEYYKTFKYDLDYFVKSNNKELNILKETRENF